MRKQLFFRKNYWQFIIGISKFRIYDCLERGYVVMTHTGTIVGVADDIVQAQQLATAYKG